MRYFVYVTESMYQGLHGMYEQSVIDADSFVEAYDMGLEMGESLIHSYSEIEDIFIERYEADEEYQDSEDIEISVWKVRDEVKKRTDDLDHEAYYLGVEDFVQKYCEEI